MKSIIWSLLVGLEGLLLVLLLVAFFILCERKVLSYIQLRKGPNKVGLAGLLQSFADFMKLVVKIKINGYVVHSWFGWLGCFMLFFCSCMGIYIYSCSFSNVYYKFMMLYILIVFTFISYGLLMLGWASWNKYSLLSAVRIAFSSVSYEMIFMCVLLIFGMLLGDYGNMNICLMSFITPLNYIVWVVSMFSESNRVPFDYGESESELVSGLNTEYSGIPFMTIYACESVMIYIVSWLTSVIFWGSMISLILFHLFLFIWARGTFPRVRYDYYVVLVWKYGLVVSLLYVVCCFGLII
uniref:NADH-ubiquinone oxidoreductase chain 1 n=2 Tax=Schistosoma mekongi TaxID=38744 RepID=Q9B8U6_SCHME|nr:NADH dehydrogenase subunit 1 [Schistosoma mekongi]AAG12185.2 NADH dehydrogenase subunit 1 [Schistosoma mekongi]